jgi:hypothetical protein
LLAAVLSWFISGSGEVNALTSGVDVNVGNGRSVGERVAGALASTAVIGVGAVGLTTLA